MENIREKISEVINANPTLNLYFVLKIDNQFEVKRADVDNDSAGPELCKMFVEQLDSKIIKNEDLALINLSSADERNNAIYKYDYDEYPEELMTIKNFEISSAVKYEKFNFNNDDVSKIFAFIIYMGNMNSGITLFKKHYPVTMIKRGTFLLYKRGERLVKFDDTDIFRINGNFNIFKIDNELFIKDLPVLEKNCGFEKLIINRANRMLESISEQGLVDNIDDLKDAASDISYAKKLSKVYTNSPVVKKNIPNQKIIEFCKTNPGLKNAFKYTDDGEKFILDTKTARNLFIKLLNDDYLISELTNSYYDSIAKDNIPTT